jgi:ribonucleoside-triphosphate reductase
MTYTEDNLEQITQSSLKNEISSGIQTIQYQINTFNTSNGQSPFLTIFMYLKENPEYIKETAMLIEEVLNQRYLGMKNEKGVYITPAFPKLIYVLDDNNIPKDSEYRYLTDLSIKCVAKRMMPDFISAKIMRENYDGEVFAPMGCRSFLPPWKDSDGKYKWYGRFNQGVCTLNLVDVGLSANKDMNRFWDILEDRLNLCKRALILRHERLEGTSSGVSPIHWQHGALARLSDDDTITNLLHGGYSSISLGYAGLYECVLAMMGVSHTTEEGKEFALEIVKYLRDTCDRWKKETNIGFGLYGTPLESTTYKFAKCLRKRFGVIEGITDKDYIANSYHVAVTEEIDPFEKLKFESEFQKLSSGGAVSYIEVANLSQNLDVLDKVVDYMYDTIQYAEINTKSDYCQVCGFDGEILVDDNMEWYCPNCGNRDHNKLNVCRRTWVFHRS